MNMIKQKIEYNKLFFNFYLIDKNGNFYLIDKNG